MLIFFKTDSFRIQHAFSTLVFIRRIAGKTSVDVVQTCVIVVRLMVSTH